MSGSLHIRRLRVWPLACYRVVAFYVILVALGLCQLLWSLVATVLYWILPEAVGKTLGRRFVSSLYRNCFRVTAWAGLMKIDSSALEAIDPDEALIIAPNHPSVLDALILFSRLKRLNCIMKASVLDNLLLGAAARLAGYIRNDGPRRMLRLATEDLKDGGQLIIFPEATRTLAAPVNPFTSGFAAMARASGVPIQTVFIETDTPFLSKGWPVTRRPHTLPMTFRVRLGRRFEIARQDDIETFVTRLRAYFADELANAQLGELWQPDPARLAAVAGDAPRRDGPREGAASPLSLTSSRWT